MDVVGKLKGQPGGYRGGGGRTVGGGGNPFFITRDDTCSGLGG